MRDTPWHRRALMAGVFAAALVRNFTVQGGEVVISEFMAVNGRTLSDEDGDFSDWIEIQNRGLAPVDLGGWYLTDDAADLRRWRFPERRLPAGGFLVLFASGKNRRAPAGELHTSFSLEGDGEYLALVEPDGATIATEFAPQYPPQRRDISYGIGRRATRTLLDADSPATAIIPTPASAVGRRLEVLAAVGYQVLPEVPLPPPLAVWGFDGDVKDATAQRYGTKAVGPTFSDDTPPGLNSKRSLRFDGADDAVRVSIDLPQTDYTVSLWFRALRGDCGLFEVSDMFGREPTSVHDRDLFLRGGEAAAFVSPDETIASKGRNYADGVWHHLVHVLSRASGGQRLYVDGELVARGQRAASEFTGDVSAWIGASKAAASRYFAGWIDEVALWDQPLSERQVKALASRAPPLRPEGLGEFIRSDVRQAMRGVAASLSLRIPFEVGALPRFDELSLRLRYDDGFVAYLNGAEVARRDAPATLDAGAVATRDRPITEARRAEDFALTEGGAHLRPGKNELEVIGLNENVSSDEFLLAPELALVERLPRRFMDHPTPGAPNEAGAAGLAATPVFSVSRGFFEKPFRLEISSAAGASILFTLDGSEPGPGNPAAKTYTGPLEVSGTTVVRALALGDQLLASRVETQSFIFPALVARQPAQPAGFPAFWGTWKADYEVDPEVVDRALDGYRFEDGLRSLPALSIAADPESLFGRVRGIYVHPVFSGARWEPHVSVELLSPDRSEAGFQVDAGLHIHGNASRKHRFTLKKSFRIRFRSRHGVSRLEYPLFSGRGDGPERFDQLVLRGLLTDSWVAPGGFFIHGMPFWEPHRATYIRDQWIRDSALAMGQPGARGRFVHLFLNGLYWGLYNLSERLGAEFCAQHGGGAAEDYDVIKDHQELHAGNRDAWERMLRLAEGGLAGDEAYWRIQGLNPDGTVNPAHEPLLDAGSLIDYQVLHIYAGAVDWPDKNWWAARPRVSANCGFRFFAWDQEVAVESLVRIYTHRGSRIEEPNSSPSPAYLSGKLAANPTYRRAFGDRVQRHLFGGALSAEASRKRWNRLAGEIDKAIVCESARWGDARRAQPFRREDWLAELRWMEEHFWPAAQDLALYRFRRAGLFPGLPAPAFQVGGRGSPGGRLGAGERLALVVSEVLERSLVPFEAAKTAHVPADQRLGTHWRQLGFVEGKEGEHWRKGRSIVGYKRGEKGIADFGIDLLDMYGRSNSVYVRIPFELRDRKAIDGLEEVLLKVMYDDGFVAYLNGERIAAANAPAEENLTWESEATITCDANVEFPEPFPLRDFRRILRPGQNLLALQVLNQRSTSSDLLMGAALFERHASLRTGVEVFYTLDGRDPMASGALRYREPLALDRSTKIKARAFDGREWSALAEAGFSLLLGR